MARKKRLSDEAEQIGISFTPEEQLVLQVIRGRRKKRGDPRSGRSEVVADGLWRLLADENVGRHQIEELLRVEASQARLANKVKSFPPRD
jgi:hypothetical protein